jgi:roadblock/LC7 domain-containing protein
MSFTSSDLISIDSAIASGELVIQFSDGKRVQYRSIDELMKARGLIVNEIAVTTNASSRSTLASFSKD